MANERYSKRPVGKLLSAPMETETGTRLTKPECTLFTSIPPRLTRLVQGRDFGLAWQTACIKSWRDSGFRIVSLNTPKEIEALRSLEPEVEFVEIGPDRTRPLITDFFAAAENSKTRIAGIINADCMIIPQTRIINHFTDDIGGIVIADRINISQETLLPTGWGGGFDASVHKPDHFGLEGMQERARLFGGAARIQSAPGEGTSVTAEFPLAEDESKT